MRILRPIQGDAHVQGKLELMMGPMRSNKTAELLRRADMRRQYARQYVMVLKPSDDTKGGAGVVESRNPNGGGKMSALAFNSANPWEVLDAIRDQEQQIGKRVECVAIDEGQFVQDLFAFTRRLLELGYDVMVSGLELDFRGMPFGEMMDLSWLVRTYSGSVTELVAYCACGAKALYPQRLIDGKPAPYDSPILMAGDNYEPRCADHFILPGRPH
jgi:thymidine kinase